MLLRALTAAVGAAVSVSGVAIEAGARKALWSDGQNNAWCSELWEEAPKMLEDLEVYIADDYPGKCAWWRTSSLLDTPVDCRRDHLDAWRRCHRVPGSGAYFGCILPLWRVGPHQQLESRAVRGLPAG